MMMRSIGRLGGLTSAKGGACWYTRAFRDPPRHGSRLAQGPIELRDCRNASASRAAGVPQLSPDQGLQILKDDIDTVILDCDGVLWCGDDVLDNTVEALEVIRGLGKRLLFLTNNASKSRKAYRRKFESLGIQVYADEIVPASFCAAAYLQSTGFPADKKVFLVGNRGVEEELAEMGISFVGGEADFCPSITSAEELLALSVDPDIGAVVVGFDWNFNHDKLTYASVCLRELPGCQFVLTNGDHGDNVGGGRTMPGTGAICASVATAAARDPVVVGKGGPWLLPWLCEQYNLTDTRRACIVGDRLDTDIALGKEGGLRTFLPLTGVTNLEELVAATPDKAPDFWMPNLATLAGISSAQSVLSSSR